MAMSKRVQVAFGQRLRLARRRVKRGPIRQDAIAAALDVSRTSVSNMERGRHRVFLDQVYAAARELGVGIHELLPTVEEIFPSEPVQAAPDAALTPQAVREVGDLARSIQERAARDELGRTGQATAKRLSRS